MKDWLGYQLLKVRYKELKAKCERQAKWITLLEKSREDLRRHLYNSKTNKKE